MYISALFICTYISFHTYYNYRYLYMYKYIYNMASMPKSANPSSCMQYRRIEGY